MKILKDFMNSPFLACPPVNYAKDYWLNIRDFEFSPLINYIFYVLWLLCFQTSRGAISRNEKNHLHPMNIYTELASSRLSSDDRRKVSSDVTYRRRQDDYRPKIRKFSNVGENFLGNDEKW